MRRKFLLVSQVYAPDPAAVARLMADVGSELAHRGHDVIVVTADRGYDNPTIKYASAKTADGVDVRRLPFCSFGKAHMALRLLGGISFTIQAALRGLLLRDVDTIVVSTSPPMAALAAVVVNERGKMFRRRRGSSGRREGGRRSRRVIVVIVVV